MKIIVRIEFETYYRTFIIPCGSGNKSIKWLGIVAAQRFSNAAPNGTLRRRDDFCGITEKAQYQVEKIVLPDGKLAHPNVLICDSDLKDGDEVLVKLTSQLNVEPPLGKATHSNWSTIAFTTFDPDDTEQVELEAMDDEVHIVVVGPTPAEKEELNNIMKSKADFMRIILHSQMLCSQKVDEQVDAFWPEVKSAMPRLPDEDGVIIKDYLRAQWDIVLDLFEALSTNKAMDLDNFLYLTRETEIFLPYVNESLSTKMYFRACMFANKDSKSFSLSTLIVALLLCAQAKFNDTLEYANTFRTAHEGFDDLFHRHVLPLAYRLKLQSVLRHALCTDRFLSGIRHMNDDLQTTFTKYATKRQEMPSSILISELAEVLTQVGLQGIDNENCDKTKKLLSQGVRKGNIFGLSKSDFQRDPNEEISFPEFVEAAARAGYAKFYNGTGTEVESGTTNHQIEGVGKIYTTTTIGCLLLGVKTAADLANNNRPKSPAQNKQARKFRK